MCRVQGVLEPNHVRHLFGGIVESESEWNERRKRESMVVWKSSAEKSVKARIKEESMEGQENLDSIDIIAMNIEGDYDNIGEICSRCGNKVIGVDGEKSRGMFCDENHRKFFRENLAYFYRFFNFANRRL